MLTRRSSLIAILCLVFLCTMSVLGSSPTILVVDLRVEGVKSPLGIEEASPRFSWRYEAQDSAPRGFKQTHYRVEVASSLEKLQQGKADLWDSGKQSSSDSLSVLYQGKALASGARAYWRVTGHDTAGNTYVSTPEFFEMGLLKADDWQGANWIGARKDRPRSIAAKLHGLTDYTVQTRFRILEGAAVIRLHGDYISGAGYDLAIHPGQPGKVVVLVNHVKPPVRVDVLREIPLSESIDIGQWYEIRAQLNGPNMQIALDGQNITSEPIADATYKTGTALLGVAGSRYPKGKVQFDDFLLQTPDQWQYEEHFSNDVLSPFQDYFWSQLDYSRVKDGVLELRNTVAALDPKNDLEAPRFRKVFTKNAGKIVRARAYVSGLGYYTFWLNGKRIDDYQLHPGFARYNKTAYYTVYDISKDIQATNTLAFELGRGWYGMTTPTLWGETFSNDWMAEPALRVLVTIDYEDGTRQKIISDPSFKTGTGPILFDSVKEGEIYDARKETPGWNSQEKFDDANWKPAIVQVGKMPSAAPGLTAGLFEPIRTIESFPAQTIEKIVDEEDAWLVDFGKHLAGTVEMKLRAASAGQIIRLQYVEKLKDKRRGWKSLGAPTTGAYQTDIYVAKGMGEEVYQSSYSYKGFRYVRLEGVKDKPSVEQLTAKAINSDMTRVGQFECSSDLWNKIWEAGRRSIQSNMHSIPTDCPSQEKLGWTCDDALPYYAMAYNYDLRKLYEKRLQDYADDISPTGQLRNTIPSTWAKGSDPAWVGSYVNIAWKQYQTYGDRRMLERHYDNLKLYMETLIQEGNSSELPPLLTTPRKALGDWVSPDGTNVPPEGALIYYNAYFYRYVVMMVDIATVLGRTDDLKYYSTLRDGLKKAFNEFHWDEKEGCYFSTNKNVGYRQAPNTVAMAFGLVPEDRAPRVTARLLEDIRTRNGHFYCGILGVETIADALCDNGQTDVAYEIHLKTDYPSLGNMIREGATTLWEEYSLARVRSMNHKMFATPLGWMARYVAGLSVESIAGNQVGFRHAQIMPFPDSGQLEFATIKYDSPMGRYESGWRRTPEGMVYDIVVPPNASATTRLPVTNDKSATVTESGVVLWSSKGTKTSIPGCGPARIENGRVVFEVAAGRYHFVVGK